MKWMAAAAALVCVACSSDASGPNETVNLTGGWNFSASYNSSQVGVSCVEAGNVNISQSGSNFTGTYAINANCTGGGQTISDSYSGQILGGQVNGQTVTFSSGSCNYTGAISGNPANRITGSLSCTVPVSGVNVMFNGSWNAGR